VVTKSDYVSPMLNISPLHEKFEDTKVVSKDDIYLCILMKICYCLIAWRPDSSTLAIFSSITKQGMGNSGQRLLTATEKV
jgi:hypothetical protein